MSTEPLASLIYGAVSDLEVSQLFALGLVVMAGFLAWLLIRSVVVDRAADSIEQYNADLYQWIQQTDILNPLTLLVPFFVIRLLVSMFAIDPGIIRPLATGIMDLLMVLIILTIAFSLGRLLAALGIGRYITKPETLKAITTYGSAIGFLLALLFGFKCYYYSVMILPETAVKLKLAWGAGCAIAFLVILFRVLRREATEAQSAVSDMMRRPQKQAEDNPFIGVHIVLDAILDEDTSLLEQLLQQGADINAMTDAGNVPLIEAVKHNLLDMVVLLLKNGGRTDLRDKEGWTPLTLAAGTGKGNIAHQLIRNGADVNATDGHGWTPLTWALHSGHSDIEKLLIEKGGKSDNYKWARLPDRIAILNFLLNLYRLQIGARPDSARRFFPTSFDVDASDLSYRLEVNIDEDTDRWSSRIVSLSMLGEGSGSKSRCYKVIFDTIWVVKIPPVPITQFEAYSGAVKAERMTLDQLSDDFLCIAPGIADILKKIPGFNPPPGMDSTAAEKLAVDWLTENPGFQKYLKINGAFAFFMDISQYLFLNQYIEKLHSQSIAAKIKDELPRQPALISDPIALETTYGEEYGDLCHQLHDFYLQFETEMSLLLKTDNTARQISPHELKNWFVAHVFGQSPDTKQALSPELTKQKNELLKALSKEYGKTVAVYRKLVLSRIATKNFKQSASRIADVIKNLLLLLVKLQERGISMRDLKPDNLFIIEESQGNKSSESTLGIIDFETAIHINEAGDPITQPFLGGTPSYATPSHLVGHQALYDLLGAVAPIYYYQDWYAVVAMIYGCVTGNLLFTQTARALIKVVKAIRQHGTDAAKRMRCFKSESFDFWQSVWQEFDLKSAAVANRLDAVTLTMPDEFRELLLASYQQQKQMCQQRVYAYILSATPFNDQKINQRLLVSPAKTIKKQRENWETNTRVPEVKPVTRKKIIAFLGRLETLQQQAEKLAEQFRKLTGSEVTVNAGALMEMMLICVYSNMYQNQWQAQQKREKKALPSPTPETRPASDPIDTEGTTLQAEDHEMSITLSTT